MKTKAEYMLLASLMLSKWATYPKVEPEQEEPTAQECEDDAIEAYVFSRESR